MAGKILLYKNDNIEIYTIKGFPKDKSSPSLNHLEKIEITLQQFILTDLIIDLPPATLIFSATEPELSLIKEAHQLFKQLIQFKIEDSYIAVNLFSIN